MTGKRTALMVILGGTLLLGQVQAQPAVYVVEDAQLNVGDAVVLQYGRASHYRHVKFKHSGSGVWRFAGGTLSQLATVTSVEIVSLATVPAQVEVTLEGVKSLECIDLEDVAIHRQGTTFYLILAETTLPDNVRCTAGVAPFAVTVELPVEGLAAGPYAINANGMMSHFDLLEP